MAAHAAGKLRFLRRLAHLNDAKAFAAHLKPLRKRRWFVYAKRPFAGPKAVLAYLSRYTHRVAISNRRLIAADGKSVTFNVKDYRVEGPGRYTNMTLATGEFIRRFLIHVLPKGFHRIRHYGLLASGTRARNLAKVRGLLGVSPVAAEPGNNEVTAVTGTDPIAPEAFVRLCPCCQGHMGVIEVFARGSQPSWRSRGPPPVANIVRIDTS